MGLNETLLGVIDELYAGALDHARLSTSLGRIAGLGAASGGLMYLLNEIDHRVVFGAWSNFEVDTSRQVDGAHAIQVGHYHRQMPVGAMTHVHTLWPIEEMKRTWFYQDVLKRQDICYGGGCVLIRTAALHGVVMLNRSEHAGPFSEREFDLFGVVIPHLRRVLQITMEMNAISGERDRFVSALDHLSAGVIFTDGPGKPIHLNRAAERMIASNDGLAIRGGRLSAAHDDDDGVLARLVGSAAIGGPSNEFQRGGSCRVTRASGKAPWLLLVAPCGDIHLHLLSPAVPACVIFIHDPAARTTTAEEVLRQLFGLTGQESKVAVLTGDGQGMANVAEQMGLSTLTVRNHLQRVFAKTSTSRQAELVRLVAALNASVPGNSD